VLRHEFRPGRLVAGAAFTLAGIVYAGDAGGLWETPWFAVIPVVVAGLCLAGATGLLTRAIRRRRGPRRGTPAQAGADTAV
jgi:drug/metabolite transporter (DMT)-like permease